MHIKRPCSVSCSFGPRAQVGSYRLWADGVSDATAVSDEHVLKRVEGLKSTARQERPIALRVQTSYWRCDPHQRPWRYVRICHIAHTFRAVGRREVLRADWGMGRLGYVGARVAGLGGGGGGVLHLGGTIVYGR
jgi:hypothetical protein